MSLTSALFTGLSGLTANSQAINISGNNIANSNTTAFKSSRIEFETSITQNLQSASGPNGESGGSNPLQVGLGVRIGGVSRNFNSGAVSPTGRQTDMAIEGGGFFILQREGRVSYTRAGNFSLDRDSNLVSTDGARVQGFGVDSDFNVLEGATRDINIPIGTLTLAEATNNVQFSGNLNASGEIGTVGSIIEIDPLFDPAQPAGFADTASLLTDLQNAAGGSLFATGDVITLTGALKGGAEIPNHTFEVGATPATDSDAFGTTLDDLMTFLDSVLGLDEVADPTAGITVDPATGVISIVGNRGTVNDLDIQTTNFVVNQATSPQFPLGFDKSQAADGESIRTTFVAFDSLGSPMTVDLTVVLEDKTNTGTVWRFMAQSEDDTDLDRVLGTGTLNFDNNGQLTTVIDDAFTIDRTATGAMTPQTIRLQFDTADTVGGLSALSDVTSQVTAVNQDGSPIGSLQDFAVGNDGTLTGVFSNGLLRTLGRVALATFANPGGLLDVGGNQFIPTANSGAGAVVNPGSSSTGRIVGQALELSNVDLSNEFINLITASTGFSASSRVMSTSDELLQELLAIVR